MFKGDVDKDVLTLGRERVAECFDRFDKVSVSFSGGKDSTVILNLALEEHRRRKLREPLDVVFWDEEAIHPTTIEYMERVRKVPGLALRWICMPCRQRNACSPAKPWWGPWAPEDRERWVRPLPENVITEMPGFERISIDALTHVVHPNEGKTIGYLVGIRAAESMRRFRSVTFRNHDNWIAGSPSASWVSTCKPIYDWATADVWTAPAKLGWDYNRTYDLMRQMGISPHVQRVCAPYGEEPLQNLWMYAQGWPDLWERMIQRLPGVATAARYSRSPLYGFNGGNKPPDQTWQEAIQHVLKRWEPEMRRKISARIRVDIELHNKKTGGAPIPEDADYGLTWKFLYMIATRGDYRNRKAPRFKNDVVKGS